MKINNIDGPEDAPAIVSPPNSDCVLLAEDVFVSSADDEDEVVGSP